MLKHLHVCNAALSNRVVQPSCESRQKHIYSKNGGEGKRGDETAHVYNLHV